MKIGKRTIILVIVALILAVTAIAVNVTDDNSASTEMPSDLAMQPGAEVGVTVIQNEENIEDKLSEENLE